LKAKLEDYFRKILRKYTMLHQKMFQEIKKKMFDRFKKVEKYLAFILSLIGVLMNITIFF